jgi:Na+/melibiose symporter-like transporter
VRQVAEQQGLRVRTKAAYAIGASGEAAITAIFNTFNFLFYNNVLGLSGTLCGLAVTVAMVFDALSDPLVGGLSDRWRSRFGRCHPFLYASALPAGLFFVCIYSPPAGLEQLGLFAWFTTSTVLLRTAMTLYYVPHLALGAEMTTGYAERSVLMSYNTIFGLVSTFGVGYIAWWYFGTLEKETADRDAYATIASVVACFSVTVFLASAFFTRGQAHRLSRAPANLKPFSAVQLFRETRTALSNRNYRMLLLGLVCLSATIGFNETFHTHVALFFWELDSEQIRLLYFAAPPGLIIAAALTPRLHVWFEKRETLIGGVLGMTLAGALPIILRLLGWFPENDAPAFFPTLAVARACSYATSAVLVISIVSTLADVTDEHELLTHRRQEGIFFAARSFFSKLTSGLGHLLAGIAIDVIHFPIHAEPGDIDPDVLFDFGIAAGPLGQLPAWASLYFYLQYRIDKARHAEIRGELQRRAPAQPDS